MSAGRNLRRTNRPDTAARLSGNPLDRIQASLDVTRDLIRLGLHETDDYRIETALDRAQVAVEQARALVAGAMETVRHNEASNGGATASQLRRAFEAGFAARSAGRRRNPFEDPLGIDWPGRRAHAAAWNRGRDECEQLQRIAPGAFGSSGQEVRVAASRDILDHRRRMLEHQEKVAAERRTPGAEPASAAPMEPQLKIPLIGEVRRSEPTPPKPRRPRTKKPIQPRLGEP